MTTTLKERYLRARDSFWFLPALLVLAAVVLSQVAVLIDRQLELAWASTSALALGVDGSRGLLTVIGGSVLGVAATAFSITVSVIATASSSYGPRLVRNFMADRGNQLVLGIFVSTFAYCVLVLRSVTAADSDAGREAFIPYIAVYLAIVIALVNIGCLVYFIHHIADSIQISTLVETVRNELRTVAEREYPEDAARWADSAVAASRLDPGDPRVVEVTMGSPGYVVGVDADSLVSYARKHDVVVEIVPRVGDHVIATEPVARIRAMRDAEIDQAVEAAIRRRVSIDDARSPYQDVRFAIQQLVEMAVRALSPGTNDPFTAQNAIEELGSGLAAIARGTEQPDGIADSDGELRLVLRRPRPLELVDLVFDDLRSHGSAEMRVIRPAIQLAKRIAEAGSPELAQRAWMHVDLLLDAYGDSGAPEFDVDRMRELATTSTQTLRRHPWPPEPTR
ncbi:DUF2254 domain-containing protein [Nostocoides sp. F2B08]|uniref:DUF2254 domain-containing protein n=1 Tax=Nostocoides sp. F2B08 TaxID=2653936 RepID=UPI00186ACBC8|nr:DUF2254 domain-containing protein [Tetrasphaera sp. F2B08]